MRVTSYGKTDTGKKRSLNEDAYLDCGAEGLWLVADGMGGHDSGDVASQRIVQVLRRSKVASSLSAYVNQIDEQMTSVNKELFDEFERAGTTGGSTVVGLVFKESFGVVFWAGDSRLYRLRAGRLRQLSEDHSYVEDLVRTKMIAPEEAESHPEANVINRAVGAERELFLDFDFLELAPSDRYLLCSDGLYKELSDEEIMRVLHEASTVRDAAEHLIDQALQHGGRDNVTVIVIDVDD